MTYKKFFKKAPIVSLKGQPVILFDGKHSSLLEALESKKVKVFSECRNGFCGACKTTVISGEVSYLTTPLAELKANECLPCCCVPESDLNLKLSTKGVEVVAKRQYTEANTSVPAMTKLAHES
ncbi:MULTISPECIES: class I ribonucleotide reductase maintenance protein YfaE [Shewanella]|uniref:Class I ribonucleotide reductase maintenance protein YfaE n=1 Tax=Shewanella metallivivens TaxID=2872342 RepID=A0ABT5TIE4_9GAMM|nr:class I ribonucleotide reductase maintenance protein YfaE [Shewanella metallivivens]MDD8058377.1 class I ribonucleotide reductase maintenance protein YfaE [Shewanella metallivivens]